MLRVSSAHLVAAVVVVVGAVVSAVARYKAFWIRTTHSTDTNHGSMSVQPQYCSSKYVSTCLVIEPRCSTPKTSRHESVCRSVALFVCLSVPLPVAVRLSHLNVTSCMRVQTEHRRCAREIEIYSATVALVTCHQQTHIHAQALATAHARLHHLCFGL